MERANKINACKTYTNEAQTIDTGFKRLAPIQKLFISSPTHPRVFCKMEMEGNEYAYKRALTEYKWFASVSKS